MGQSPSFRRPQPTALVSPASMRDFDRYDASRDHTIDLPDELLALVFRSLGSGDRKRCSLVCRRWLVLEGQSRHRLALDARVALLETAPALLVRFDSVSKLALKCDRRADSIGDEALGLLARGCPGLTRLKLRACRAITDAGMAALAAHCPNLRKLSCGNCTFGSKGIENVLRGCTLLEELSIKRLRGLADTPVTAGDPIAVAAYSKSLRSICLKELYNGQCFGPLIAGSPNLRSLKIIRCSGDWDGLLEDVTLRVHGIVEVHLEKLQVSDRGLHVLSACMDLEIFHLVKAPECTDAGLAYIAESCRKLRKVHIDGWKTNRIGDQGLMAVARGCPDLQELVLIGVNPTAVSLGLIAGNCRVLERLALCSSETFGDAEIACIAAKAACLKKLCIKGCPVSDLGMEALAEGCPSLVKVKLKRCKGVTPEVVEWLRACRVKLAINLDSIPGQSEQQLDVSLSDSGVQDQGDDELPTLVDQLAGIDLPSSSGGRSALSKARLGFLSGRNFMANTFRRWSQGGNNQN